MLNPSCPYKIASTHCDARDDKNTTKVRSIITWQNKENDRKGKRYRKSCMKLCMHLYHEM